MQNKIILLKGFFFSFQVYAVQHVWFHMNIFCEIVRTLWKMFSSFQNIWKISYETADRSLSTKMTSSSSKATRETGRIFFLFESHPHPTPPPCPFAQKRHEVLLSPSIANTCNIYSSQLDFLKIIWREKKITTYTPSVFYFWIDIVNLLKT